MEPVGTVVVVGADRAVVVDGANGTVIKKEKKTSHTHTHTPRSYAAEEDKNDDALRSGNVCAMILGIAQVVKSGTGGQAGGGRDDKNGRFIASPP